jgi:hypothetical protein
MKPRRWRGPVAFYTLEQRMRQAENRQGIVILLIVLALLFLSSLIE